MSEILLIVALLAILKWMIEEGIHSKAASLLAKREGSPSGASKRGNYLGLIVRGGHALLYVAFLAVVHSITMNSKLHALEGITLHATGSARYVPFGNGRPSLCGLSLRTP